MIAAMRIPGQATAAGTARYRDRHAATVVADHFRALGDLQVSSVGLGTYLGSADDAADTGYQAAAARALGVGINVLDTAVNYRCQRSERTLGKALVAARAAGIERDEIVVATKGGFLPYDGARPADLRDHVERTWIAPGLARWDDIVAGCHCLAPRYLADQIERSRANLGLDTLDIYYLHNPETQLEEIDRATFERRLAGAFEVLEEARAAGRVVRYGVATWTALRDPPGARGHLDLAALVALARQVGGDRHGFAVVQLPLNQRMTEAATAPSQGGRPLLDAAAELGVYVMASATIMQGRLAAVAGSAVPAIEWVRTRPGLGTALIGMGRARHVEDNAAGFRARS